MNNAETNNNEEIELKTVIEPALSFKLNGFEVPILQVFPNGDFYVKGNLVERDIEVFNAFKEWLIISGMIKEETNTPE